MTFEVRPNPTGWDLVEEIEITAATQNKDFTPTLDGDNDCSYVIEGCLINDQAGATNWVIRINGATAAGNRQYILANGAAVSSNRDANMYVSNAAAQNDSATFQLHIPAARIDYPRTVLALYSRYNAASLQLYHAFNYITTPAVGTNITSLGIGSDTASGIGVGSVLRLWKRRKA